jgi:hypothetical protein
LRDAVVPDGQYHGGVGRTPVHCPDLSVLDRMLTQDSQLVGELMIQVQKGVRRYGW